ncbi:hypothetical protein HORIV_33440 [Vreelandella olivaria]|uniref:Translation initiation factor IF-3 n=1 Tax=Vreelandella olivaria TaxID=390919 RepID=A0ABN5X1F1_9GAMM|nr:hypothetical protein HORIV_33440 [Halomonas olivaria]
MNERIVEEEVRLIGSDGEQLGVVPTTEALERAESESLDLVQISNADPIVCKIMDYGKFVLRPRSRKRLKRRSRSKSRLRKLNSVLAPMKAIIRLSLKT